MSERLSNVPADVREAKAIKRWVAVFCFGIAGTVSIAGVFVGFNAAIYGIVTLFIGAGCLLLDVALVSVIRAMRGRNGS